MRSVPEMIAKSDVKGLVKALADKNPHLRYMAAVGLGLLGDRSAVEPLMVALSDKDHFVRNAVAEALLRLGQSVTPDSSTAAPPMTPPNDEAASDLP
ncbi:MAG: HEAT repeat domain-containing protein [Demequinaceae bacterium]|nr:HEAT repeat domain-containing protein [Demequinaceae bacterium]